LKTDNNNKRYLSRYLALRKQTSDFSCKIYQFPFKLRTEMSSVSGYERIKRFKPQQTALAGGFLLMLSSGIHIGFGLFHWNGIDVAWTRGSSPDLIAFAIVAWFVGGIVGFTLAPLSLKWLAKKKIYVRCVTSN